MMEAPILDGIRKLAAAGSIPEAIAGAGAMGLVGAIPGAGLGAITGALAKDQEGKSRRDIMRKHMIIGALLGGIPMAALGGIAGFKEGMW